jgi:hypothetical protein
MTLTARCHCGRNAFEVDGELAGDGRRREAFVVTGH